jgi:hypothetical protein
VANAVNVRGRAVRAAPSHCRCARRGTTRHFDDLAGVRAAVHAVLACRRDRLAQAATRVRFPLVRECWRGTRRARSVRDDGFAGLAGRTWASGVADDQFGGRGSARLGSRADLPVLYSESTSPSRLTGAGQRSQSTLDRPALRRAMHSTILRCPLVRTSGQLAGLEPAGHNSSQTTAVSLDPETRIPIFESLTVIGRSMCLWSWRSRKRRDPAAPEPASPGPPTWRCATGRSLRAGYRLDPDTGHQLYRETHASSA